VSVVEQYRALYAAIERRDEADVAARLEVLYDERAMFQDPFVTVLGRDEFIAMNRRALKNTRAIETEILDSSETADQLFMTWKMRYVTKLGPTLAIEGASHVRVRSGKVTHQRDYWDLLGSLAAGIPAVGHVYRMITSKLV
jgi:limonene-1,2-epoxide hydrolase